MITEKIRKKVKQKEKEQAKIRDEKEKKHEETYEEIKEYFHCLKVGVCPVCGEDLLEVSPRVMIKSVFDWKHTRTAKRRCPNNCKYRPPHFGSEVLLDKIDSFGDSIIFSYNHYAFRQRGIPFLYDESGFDIDTMSYNKTNQYCKNGQCSLC